jgi:hypothetical protein
VPVDAYKRRKGMGPISLVANAQGVWSRDLSV